jgi:hypothetical protein
MLHLPPHLYGKKARNSHAPYVASAANALNIGGVSVENHPNLPRGFACFPLFPRPVNVACGRDVQLEFQLHSTRIFAYR